MLFWQTCGGFWQADYKKGVRRKRSVPQEGDDCSSVKQKVRASHWRSIAELDLLSSDVSSDASCASESSMNASEIVMDRDDRRFFESASTNSSSAGTHENSNGTVHVRVEAVQFENPRSDEKTQQELQDLLTSQPKLKSKQSKLACNGSGRVWHFLLVIFTLVFVHDFRTVYSMSRDSANPIQANDCIYVPGGGFSGFWYTLGRLQSIPKEERLDHDYYCYSAGCLAVVASAILDRGMEDMYRMAQDVQNQWKTGEIDRYSVVRAFLDDMLKETSNSSQTATDVLEPPLSGLSKIHIITTAQQDWLGMTTEIRTASNLQELHEMLLQTTWIPFAVGDSLWQNGHMDGAFSALYHPSCDRQMGLGMNPWLLANVINVNLPRSAVEMFWNLGLEHGF